MRKWIQAAVVSAGLLSSRVAQAQTYNFLVDYLGSGNAVQASGSDNILGTNILPTDSFFWRISAVGGQWRTTNGVSQFPFMAFDVNECGVRYGDYTLNLFSGATNVLADVQTNVWHSCVHLGTNAITLPNNLIWDRMELQFTLISATEDPLTAPDPNNLQPINSTIISLLPIFGAPEQNQYNTPGDIVYESSATVPEPSSFVLMGLGVGVLGVFARRRRT